LKGKLIGNELAIAIFYKNSRPRRNSRSFHFTTSNLRNTDNQKFTLTPKTTKPTKTIKTTKTTKPPTKSSIKHEDLLPRYRRSHRRCIRPARSRLFSQSPMRSLLKKIPI
jgi:hypothetical protein